MAAVTHVEPAAANAQSLETQLSASLAARNSTAEIVAALDRYRRTRGKDVFRGPHNAPDRVIEDQIWEAHSRVNAHYKKLLSQLHKGRNNHVVELRKLEKEYTDFIKSTQRFYRHHIQLLDEHYDGIPEMRHTAQLVSRSGKQSSSAASPAITPEIRQKVLISCYHALVHLGDLSRYRETLPGEKEHNWGPAVGYYSLAMEIYPDSGMAHNQLAVIALTDGNHFRATYHLYRSLSVKEPYPLAKGNLEQEFKRVLSAREKGELISKTRLGTPIGSVLVAHFVHLHAKCYRGEDFPEHDELENEVLSQLAVELKERSLEGMLQKIALINIAAESRAAKQLQAGNQTTFQSYFYFLRLNVKTFFTLLQVFQPELERLTEEDDQSLKQDRQQQPADKISPIARRVLPGLRLYSAWFSKNRAVLSTEIPGSLSNVETQQLWKAYAETLTMLNSAFPARNLPTEDYMLEEDTDSIGFTPLESEKTRKAWFRGDKLKARWSDENVGRNLPNVEMLMRVRDLLIDGALLVQDETVPLALDNGRFIYQEAGLPSELLASPSPKADSPPATATVDRMDIPQAFTSGTVPDDQMTGLARSESNVSTSVSKDPAMNRMVDNLVGDDALGPLPEEDENIPPTPPEQTFMDTVQISEHVFGPVNANDLVQQMLNYTKPKRSPETPVRTPQKAPSPTVKQFPLLPTLPHQSDIWNPRNGSPGPSSPFFPPGLEPHAPAANGYSVGHSRNPSSTSIRTAVPTADAWNGSSLVTPLSSVPPQQQGYPNHGYVSDRRSVGVPPGFALPAQVHANTAMASPLLFGGGGGPFSSDMRRSVSSPYRRTPPNGQAG